ncbi:hypothetical protein HDU81_000887, partial [Chytriomyces hyalinus]
LFTDTQLQSEFDAASEYVHVVSVVLDERQHQHQEQEQQQKQEQKQQELIQPAPPIVSQTGTLTFPCDILLDLIEADISNSDNLRKIFFSVLLLIV